MKFPLNLVVGEGFQHTIRSLWVFCWPPLEIVCVIIQLSKSCIITWEPAHFSAETYKLPAMWSQQPVSSCFRSCRSQRRLGLHWTMLSTSRARDSLCPEDFKGWIDEADRGSGIRVTCPRPCTRLAVQPKMEMKASTFESYSKLLSTQCNARLRGVLGKMGQRNHSYLSDVDRYNPCYSPQVSQALMLSPTAAPHHGKDSCQKVKAALVLTCYFVRYPGGI